MSFLDRVYPEKAVGDPGNRFGHGLMSQFIGGGGNVAQRSTSQILRSMSRSTWPRLAGELVATRYAQAQWSLLRPTVASIGSRSLQEFKTLFENPPMGHAQDPVNVRRGMLVAEAKSQALVVEQQDHPYLTMVRRGTMDFQETNFRLSGHAVMKARSRTIESVGEWFELLFRLGGDIPRMRMFVPPTWVTIPLEHEDFFRVQMRNTGTPGFTVEKRVLPRDMAMYRDTDLENPYSRGLGTGHSTDDELRIDELYATMIAAKAANNGMPAALVLIAGMDPQEQTKLKENWLAETHGVEKTGSMHFVGLEDGMNLKESIMIHEMDSSVADLDTSTIRRHQRDSLLQGHKVPPLVAGVHESGNRAMALVAEKGLELNAVVPALERDRSFEQARYFEALGGRPAEYRGGFMLLWNRPQLSDEGSRDRLMAQVPWAFNVGQLWEAAGFDPPSDEALRTLHAMPKRMTWVELGEDPPEPTTAGARPPG